MNRKFTRAKKDLFKKIDDKRVIWLEGNIDNRAAFIIETIINKLNKASHDPILLFITGKGGDFYAVLKIMKMIENSPSKFIIIAFKEVLSGSFLLTQAKNAESLAVPGTKFIFHNAVRVFEKEQLPKRFLMAQKELTEEAKKLAVVDAIQLLIFSERGRPIKKIFDLFHNEAEIDIKKALELKLVDGILNKRDFLRFSRKFSANNG